MTEVKPVAWTQPSQLAILADDPEGSGEMWAKRDMEKTREWWRLVGIDDGPDDVPLYAESDFIAMKERAEKAEAEIKALQAANIRYVGTASRLERELASARQELRSLKDNP